MSVSKASKTRSASLILAIAAALLLGAAVAQAADLDQAKRQGMVCELPTGYLRATTGSSGDIRAMVDRINAKRREEYSRIADEHGITPQQVGKMTAKKLSPRCR